MNVGQSLVMQASAVAISGQALIIEGPPGSGKSSLALALIERGAGLIGDDGVSLTLNDERLMAAPPPNIGGLLEIRGVGIVRLPVANASPVALILSLGKTAERLPGESETRELLGCDIPTLPFDPGTIASAARAEWALRLHGLANCLE